MRFHPGRLAVALAMSLAWTALAADPATAQPRAAGALRVNGGRTGASAPWARGVSAAQRRRATEHYRAGKSLLERALLAQALAEWHEALSAWNHPYLRWKLALLHIKLGDPVEAWFHIEEAGKWGSEPFSDEEWQHVLATKRSLDQQVAWITVVCQVAGGRVTLDGKYLFTGPGRASKLVTSGRHQIVAEKGGHRPDTHSIVLQPGQRAEIELEPRPEGATPLPSALPWGVLGGGVIVALAAIPIEAQSQIDRNDHDARCGGGGPECDALRKRAERLRMAAIASGLVGVGAILAGVFLARYNRSRLPAEPMQATAAPGVVVAPFADGTSAGIRAVWQF